MSNSRIIMLVVVILLAVALLFLGSLVLGVKQGKVPKLSRLSGVNFRSEYQTSPESILKDLRQESKEINISLSDSASVRECAVWLITDGDEDSKKKYIALKEDDSLKIYRLSANFKPGYQSSLESRGIPKDLKQEFKNNNISLSDSAFVDACAGWLITDGDEDSKKKYYIALEEDGSLKIYGLEVPGWAKVLHKLLD